MILYFLLTATLSAQFGEVSTTFDLRLMRESERQTLLPLKDEISQFFRTTSWDNDFSDLEIPLHIQIIFEGTASKGAETTYLAQMLISNGTDQRYFDKSMQFTYNAGTALFYSPGFFEPLPSLVAYYGYLVLAGEADTYDFQGGSQFYEICREIALRGTSSNYPKGWTDRLNTADNLSSNGGLRQAKLAFYYGRDLFAHGEPERAIKQFTDLIHGLDKVFMEYGREHYTSLFMQAHAREIAHILGVLGQKELLQDLLELDPDNEEDYNEALEKI